MIEEKKETEISSLNEKQKNLLTRIKNESHRIAHLVGFDKFTELHSKWLNKMITCKDIYVLKAHRGSFKSSVITLLIALLIICKPNKTILFMRKTDNDVKEIVEKVSKILHTDVFQAFSQILYGQGYQFTKDTAFEINTTLKTDLGGKSQLIALGSSGSLTGKHADYIIVDDLCFVAQTKIATPFGDRNIEDIKVGDLVLTTNGFQKVIRNSKRQAYVISNVGLCGTPNHPVFSKEQNNYIPLEDIKEHELVRLYNNKKYECQNLSGIQTVYNLEVENTHNYYANGILVHNCNIKDRTSRAERERIKNVWMELQNVKNRDGVAISIGTVWHKQDVFSLMPPAEVYTCYDTGLMSNKEIENIKKTMTPALFAANYELKFIANEDALFTDIRYLRHCDLTEEEIKLQVKPKDFLDNGIAHLDASYGGGDTTALTIMKKLPDGRIIAFGKVWEKHVKHCMNDIIMLCNFYNARSLWMETNGDKGYLAQEFRNRGVKVMTYHEKMNKDVKIQTYLYGAWQDIYWLEETDANYINQIMDYTENAEIVDACFVAGTKIKTIFGDRNIEDIKVGDLVYTPLGYKKVLKTHQRKKDVITNLGLTGTFDHKVFNKKLNRFVNLCDLTCLSDCDILNIRGMIKWQMLKKLNLTEKFIERREIITSLEVQKKTEKEVVNNCIRQFGNFIMEGKFLKAIMFIIKILMLIIMTLAIWLLWKPKNIYHYMRNIICQKKNIERKTTCNWKKSDHLQQNGINPKKVENGIGKIQEKLSNNELRKIKQKNVKFVEKNLLLHSQQKNIVAKDVQIEQEQIMERHLLENVSFVAKIWNYLKNKKQKNIAVQNVFQEQKIKDEKKSTVYNITVDDVGCYYANDILVSNCDSGACVCRLLTTRQAKAIEGLNI